MIDRRALLNDLKQQVTAVEADLGKQVGVVAEGERLRSEYERARKLGRTAATWNSWLDDRVTQVAVAWVLGAVFVRFVEDNGLIPEPYLTAPEADRRDLALARFEEYVSESEDPTYRGWLEHAFAELGAGQAGRLLFDRRHNPLFQIPLSHDGARELVEFWRQRDADGALVHDFTDPLKRDADGTRGWDTRFLGDLYQDLDGSARKTYALLQTPEFVTEFILDRTMNPAVRDFGYEGLRVIDPTCGSGHFVLAAFQRLVRLWAEGRPGKDVHERVKESLNSVHGVDLYPFAVAIARFRLLVAAMAASGVRTLREAAEHEWPIHLAVGDSLIKAQQLELPLTLSEDEGGDIEGDPLAAFTYTTEDVHDHPEILQQGRYHVVVGNPPYITVQDKKLNQLYRELYSACNREYALSIPFTQRFFELAKQGDTDGFGYGIVGQITANSFMKREFGGKLIEEYFAHNIELTEVIDTSGAYIPGHGTPTVILVGKRRSGPKRSTSIRTVRSIQSEPSVPDEPANGLVWNAIVKQIEDPGSASLWVSVDDLDRQQYFAKHPWVLTAGGLEMIEQIALAQQAPLKDSLALGIGAAAISGEDNAFFLPDAQTARRLRLNRSLPVATGSTVRDLMVNSSMICNWPYGSNLERLPEEEIPGNISSLWPYRRILQKRRRFGVEIDTIPGLKWYEFRELYKAKLQNPSSIVFAEVATHNHFAIFEGEGVFNQTSPLIKLTPPAERSDYATALGLLSSSTACFWLKMACHNKGGSGLGRGFQDQEWENRYQFNGTNVERFPLPSTSRILLAATLDNLAKNFSYASPSAVPSEAPPTIHTLREGHHMWLSTRARMIALHEELDWQVYSLYNLYPEDLRVSKDPESPNLPDLGLGERAFEILLARQVAAGEASGEWFKRHGSTPITEVPTHWPAAYREVVQKRIDAIESSRAIGMVERPEYKRRWATEGWDTLQEKALRIWLLDRIEDRAHWFDENGMPALVTLSRLTDNLSRDEDFVSVTKIYAPRKDLHSVIAELMTDEHVPFLSSLRYKPAALKKRADWEHVWDLQRQEDAAPDEPAKRKIRDRIPVPPKYTSADFLRPSYWRARGKLDVPKERFISYARANVATPDLYGWAGWDHREQAIALDTYIATHEGLTTEEVTPLLAGLLELQPWLNQWHNEPDPLFSPTPAKFFEGDRQMEQGKHGLTDDDLRAWRPAAVTRGRRTAKK
ncbi:BREX-2 system adenine-specific DNA-methyltransferase PglX [Streptomyces sp. NPDC058257]|uniref:BREX-2 system adenine-specific DNA-methyltransferase PglX n=1 Tax=Streptomyces sp. NPDC058257 TaxID=3346409 RepID=UPI0036E6FB0A